MSNESRQAKDAVLEFLQTKDHPVSPEEISKGLKVYSPGQIREAIWRLTDALQAEITEDWKLKRTERSLQGAESKAA